MLHGNSILFPATDHLPCVSNMDAGIWKPCCSVNVFFDWSMSVRLTKICICPDITVTAD